MNGWVQTVSFVVALTDTMQESDGVPCLRVSFISVFDAVVPCRRLLIRRFAGVSMNTRFCCMDSTRYSPKTDCCACITDDSFDFRIANAPGKHTQVSIPRTIALKFVLCCYRARSLQVAGYLTGFKSACANKLSSSVMARMCTSVSEKSILTVVQHFSKATKEAAKRAFRGDVELFAF